jgi:hypothetical protein
VLKVVPTLISFPPLESVYLRIWLSQLYWLNQQAWSWPFLRHTSPWKYKEAISDTHYLKMQCCHSDILEHRTPSRFICLFIFQIIQMSNLMRWTPGISDWEAPYKLSSSFHKFEDTQLRIWKIKQLAWFWDTIHNRDRASIHVSWYPVKKSFYNVLSVLPTRLQSCHTTV